MHFPELTVGDTLKVAARARFRGHGNTPDLVSRSVSSLFGLAEAYDTKIGDAMIRGISGGEKRRTSLAEAFISDARYQFWDNSTRGLDSSTALRFIKLLRRSTAVLLPSVAVSIYQASEDMYRTFDTVLLLYEGRQIFFGPTKTAVEYFTRLGFVKPDRVTSADFLTGVTSPSERIISDHHPEAPMTPDHFAKIWRESPEAHRLREEIQKFHLSHPLAAKGEKAKQGYTVSIRQQLRICISRGALRLRHHYVPQLSAVMANSLLAVVIGTAYYNLDQTADGLERRSVLIFFALLHTSMTSGFDTEIMWAARAIVEKHDRYGFYRPSVEALSSFVCSLPLRILESVVFQVPIYFMTNLRRSASAFFTYWVFMLATILTMSLLFRLVGTTSRRFEELHVPFSSIVLLCIIYTGFVVPPTYMVGWLAWIRRINPIAYTYESLMINEVRWLRFCCSTGWTMELTKGGMT